MRKLTAAFVLAVAGIGSFALGAKVSTCLSPNKEKDLDYSDPSLKERIDYKIDMNTGECSVIPSIETTDGQFVKIPLEATCSKEFLSCVPAETRKAYTKKYGTPAQ